MTGSGSNHYVHKVTFFLYVEVRADSLDYDGFSEARVNGILLPGKDFHLHSSGAASTSGQVIVDGGAATAHDVLSNPLV